MRRGGAAGDRRPGAEEVVVGLEAVEVEERQHGGLDLVLAEPPLELGDQRSPVAEPGQRVGGGLAAARAQHAAVVAERAAETSDHGEQARGRGPHREGVELVVVVEQQDRDRGQPGGEWHGEEAAVGQHLAVELARRLPGRRGDEDHRRGPGGVEHAADLVAAARDAVEVDRVGDAEHEEAADQRRPRACRLQPEDAEQARDQAQQQQVAGRVGEVGGDGERVAAGGVEDRAVDECPGQGGEAERDDQAVDPQHPRQPARAAARQQQQAGERERVDAEIERVGQRRIGDVVLAQRLERERVVRARRRRS